MTISLLHLNINADNYWSNLIDFIKTHDFDVMQFQEVCGKNTISININTQFDGFKLLQEALADKYLGELAISQKYTSSPDAYMGNATFYKKEFQLLSKDVLALYTRDEPFPSDQNHFETVGRNLLHLKLQIADKSVSFLNTHFAWAKTTVEEPHQTQQGEILINYLKSVEKPFILSGDFNMDPKQPLINKINHLARNLSVENNTATTLNPRTHRAKVLFPPGAVVDYIYITHDLKFKKFKIFKDLDLSDHLALTAEIEI